MTHFPTEEDNIPTELTHTLYHQSVTRSAGIRARARARQQKNIIYNTWLVFPGRETLPIFRFTRCNQKSCYN